MDLLIDKNASENETYAVDPQVEDVEVFDARVLLNVCAYATMSLGRHIT